MGQSYRINTKLGINQTINVQLDQDFEFLEILSLKIQQADIYTRSCADYGVVVGRVTANNGLGIPNARVSIFIPILPIDESNPIITSIYPYKSPSDKNEDGYRYNLLPYEKSYSKHAATGTFPSRTDVLTNQTAVEVYDKYYRYTTKTNDSGDYMIFGVPLGNQTLVMDVDLSDIGEFSLTPQDLIRIGRATQQQVSGNKFKTSTDLNSLPQIVSLVKNLEVSPLWGDETLCQIAVNRVDFDLRDDANIDIQPTSVFMGSMFSSPDKFRVRKNSRPKDNLGNLCQLEAGPGQIIAIRQTTGQDQDGNPILEEYEMEQSGNVIDDDGTWMVELPMNLNYLVTNEFGERVVSNNPEIGVPTTSKYRFKIKWQQPPDLTAQTRRAYYLVPNIKEYGWTIPTEDPNIVATDQIKRKLQSSYYFGLDWSGYTDGFLGNEINDRLDEVINCEDTFYEFKYNKVYTIASLIDQYKKGGRGRFIGIKEIDDDSCSSSVNRFPVNDGFKNFDLLFFLFSILIQLFQFLSIPLLITAHFVTFLYSIVVGGLCLLCSVPGFGFICNSIGLRCVKQRFIIRLPMITYPNCQACSCKETEIISEAVAGGSSGVLSYVSDPSSYYDGLQRLFSSDGTPEEDIQVKSLIFSQAIAGNNDSVSDLDVFKTPKSNVVEFLSDESDERKHFAFSDSLTLGERINLFNTRKSYFTGQNKIQVSFAKESNIGKYHFDNTITVLSNIEYASGQLLTTVNPLTTSDRNFTFTSQTENVIVNGITGTTIEGPTTISVPYATSEMSNSTQTYVLPTGSTIDRQVYPLDREYFQVITAITVADASKIWNENSLESFPNVLNANSRITLAKKRVAFGYSRNDDNLISPMSVFTNIENQYIIVLQRGVDPYSPKYTNEYRLGGIFGSSITDPNFTFTAQTRLNIPIQRLTSNNLSVQSFSQNTMFYPSYFFTPGNDFESFKSSTVGFYGNLDASFSTNRLQDENIGGVKCAVTKTNNDFYSSTQNSAKYDLSEDVSGASYIFSNIDAFNFSLLSPLLFNVNFQYKDVKYQYFTPNAYPDLVDSPMIISNKTRNVMRNDRLPSSDALNGNSWSSNPALLQQNNNFVFYEIPEIGENTNLVGYSTGASIATEDIDGLPNDATIYDSFECENMVGLGCYQGFGNSFGINDDCTEKDSVDKGCYMFLRRPLLDLFKDIGNFNEWAYRFRFFYGLCRGVLSQTFTNNWINGTLFAFPIQVDTYFDSQNQPSITKYSKDLIFFDEKTNNFYYRSSPYNSSSNTFIGKGTGKNTNNADRAANYRNLLFPTTIIDLGYKDNFYSEIIFDPQTKGYVMSNLTPTTYGDVSDLINLFVISRITDEGFLRQLISIGDSSVNQLFSREDLRIDGDLAQLMSINSELGVIKFSPEFYEIEENNPNNPVRILGTPRNPAIAVWFSSTTENLQTKDYLTPGRINFRVGSNNFPFNYGIKSQIVPLYQWKLSTTTPIFGNQKNDWATDGNDIVAKPYQSLDRTDRTIPTYFQSNTVPSNDDTYQRGYIFSTDSSGVYSTVGASSNKFIVGAPFHFYFGLLKGKTAIDKFKTKYSIDE
jgi:hypothetical protein